MENASTYPKYHRVIGFFVMVCACLWTSACDPFTATVGAGAAVTAAAAEDRGISGVYSDTAIRARINRCWLKHEPLLMDHLFLSVQNGRVLVTGNLQLEEQKQRAMDLLHGVSGIREVIDEITVGKSSGFSDYSRDAWITTKLKTHLLFTRGIASRNYSIRTVGGKVYLMGIARNAEEVRRVVECAARIRGVKDVLNYTVLKGHVGSGFKASHEDLKSDIAPGNDIIEEETFRLKAEAPPNKEGV